MAALVVGGILVGVAMFLRKTPHRSSRGDDASANDVRSLHPAANSSIIPDFGIPSTQGANTRIRSVPVMPNRRSDGRVNMEQTLGDRLRWMPAPTAKKSDAPVVGQMFSPSINAVDNVHVRTQDITRTELQHLQRPRLQNNALPFEQMRVGPGLDIESNISAGKQGFHYGTNRMQPNDVHVHHRGQRGSVVPGKADIDKPTSLPNLRKLRPDRFYEISEEYQVSAPGRASSTAATARVEPLPRHTNRATESFGTGPAVATGVLAVSDRVAYENATDSSQRGQPLPATGQPARNVGAGYVLAEQNMSVNDNQRTTTQNTNQALLPIANPGQSLFMPSNSDAMRGTLRAGLAALPVANVAPNAPVAPPSEQTQPLRTTDRQLTQGNDYIGPAQSHLSISSEQMQRDAMTTGRVSKPTLKEMSHAAYVGNARPSLNNPTSYAELLSTEGYSIKEVVESDRMANPGRVNVPLNKEFALTQLAEEPPNAARANNLQRSAATNMYARNDVIDVNPNKELPDPNRLDPSVLTDNDLIPKIQ